MSTSGVCSTCTIQKIAYDGLHLVARGNEQVAEALVAAVLEMLPKR